MVDFVTIATEQHRWLRMLDQMLGDDDDQYSSTITTSTSTTGTTTAAMGDSAATAAEASSAPFFSKNAEAELYLLATNFLLYVALVIVVIIVCRIYFPEALQSRRVVTRIGEAGGNTAARPRNYKYRVAEEQSQYGHDDDDEEDYGYDDDEGLLVEEEVLDSSSDDEQGPASSSKTPNFLEFEQESLSRKQVLQRLIFCCIMLNITFVFWGILQVRTMLICFFLVVFILNSFRFVYIEPAWLTFSLVFSTYRTGTHVDTPIPALHGRILYVLVRLGLYE